MLLDGFAAPQIMAYQKETAIAKKRHALVLLERGNSPMNDFFDLYILPQEFGFTNEPLCAAVRDVFARRGTLIPKETPDGLTQDFAGDAAKRVQWKAFLNQNVSAPRNVLTLSDVTAALAVFLLPILATAGEQPGTRANWPPGGPWEDVRN